MKDLSFGLFKNSIRAKKRKGITTFCSDDGSTSTLNQGKPDRGDPSRIFTPSPVASPYLNNTHSLKSPPTLEQMILQLELEEDTARKRQLKDYGALEAGRMSCVNSSDILRSARDALNQYPRFSLDGKDARYRSSFRNLDNTVGKFGRKSVCCDHGLRERLYQDDLDNSRPGRTLCLPPTLAGENVAWCKPGVVAKLMGLEAVPVPISSIDSRNKLGSIIKRQNLIRRRAERNEVERRRIAMNMSSCDEIIRGGRIGSCSKAAEYCIV